MFWHAKDSEHGFQPVCLVVEVYLIPKHLIGKLLLGHPRFVLNIVPKFLNCYNNPLAKEDLQL